MSDNQPVADEEAGRPVHKTRANPQILVLWALFFVILGFFILFPPASNLLFFSIMALSFGALFYSGWADRHKQNGTK